MKVRQIETIEVKYRNNSIKVMSRFKIQMPIPSKIHLPPFNNIIEDLIKQKNLLAGYNKLVKNSIIEAYQVILAPNKQY